MINVHQLTYGPFAENTYVLSDTNNNALVIDPGMYDSPENARFFEYLSSQTIKPTRLILTHAHLDHVFGVNWVHANYGLTPEVHLLDKPIYDSASAVANQYGLKMESLVSPTIGLEEGDTISFDDTELEIVHAPGHSPGSVCFYCRRDNFLIGGDVLFQGSIGRTDLPGGDYQTLIDSIQHKLMKLPDDVIVYSGHGPLTTIGQERISNPFLVA